MIWTTIGLVLALAVIYEVYLHTVHRRYMQLGYAMPGLARLPIFGSILRAVGLTKAQMREQFFKEMHKYKDAGIGRAWMGSRLVVAVWTPRDAEVILSSHEHLDKSDEYRLFRPWLGNGLLISTGDVWRTHRKMIVPTFHQHVLRQFIDRFNDNSIKACEKLANTNGSTIDIHDLMGETTVEVLIETVMGVQSLTQKGGLDYARAVMKMCGNMHIRHLKVWLRNDWLFSRTKMGQAQEKLLKLIHSLTEAVVGARKKDFSRAQTAATVYSRVKSPVEEVNTDITTGTPGLTDDLDEDVGEKKRIAFLDLLLQASENGVGFSEQEVYDQVNTIMFEGHDTTAAGSSFFLCLMGIHQNYQEQCYEELRGIFGDSDRPATLQDTLEMKVLERCLLETLRLYPPVPAIARKLRREVTLPSGYTLPADVTVIVTQFFIHRHDDYWEKPHEFYPDHFLPEACANRNYYAFIPFSAGPRSCVGRKYAVLKLKILLSTILRNFKIESDLTEKDFLLEGSIILKRSEGFPLRFIPRKKTVKA